MRSARVRPRSFAMALAVAGLVLGSLGGAALAKTFTLNVAKTVRVSNALQPTAPSKTESILATSAGKPLYLLTGDSKSHPKCLRAACQKFWPPVLVANANTKPSKAAGIKGTLGVWHHGKMFQVTLNGHPLYTFSIDKKKGQAMGEGIKSFGGTWHVFPQSAPKKTSSPPSMPNPPLPPGY
jgi:predicted lipoprotein with Yx(FWY)xxD motif